MTDRTPTATATVAVAAAPEAVYDLVSDLPRMGEWSPENTGGRWVGKHRGAVAGARFVGTNRGKLRWWPTTTVVVDATRGRRFAFETRLGPVTAAEWAYDITPTADGCEVTESWTDLRSNALSTVGGPLTGVPDRVAFTRTMLVTTLERLKATAEGRPTPPRQHHSSSLRATSVRTVDAPLDRVWAVVADHEGMSSWAPGLKVDLTRPGTTERNGVGAVRKVGIGSPGPIVEEIVTFEPGHRLGYKALAGVPLRNYRGEITLRPTASGTEITYAVDADRRLPFGESLAAKGLATALLSGLVRGIRAAVRRP